MFNWGFASCDALIHIESQRKHSIHILIEKDTGCIYFEGQPSAFFLAIPMLSIELDGAYEHIGRLVDAVDGRNPAQVDMVNILFFTGFHR